MYFSLVAASAMAAFAQAQSSSAISTQAGSSVAATSTVSQSMPPSATAGFNGGNVTAATAASWCLGQTNTCPVICGGQAAINTCDPTSFTYSCVCQNGTVPDCTAFISTLPYFICQDTYRQCINNHPSTDPTGQQNCMTAEKCGTRNATAEYYAARGGSTASGSSSSSRTSASSTSGSSGSSSSSAAAGGASSTSSHAGAGVVQYTFTGAFGAMLMGVANYLI